jgi:hypothetical protein
LAILRKMAALKTSEDDFVFPGQKPGRPLSQHVMKTLMRYMGYNGVATAHGFRSSFKDWAHEETDFSTGAIELALAHVVGNKVEAAYRRGDLFEKRRLLSKAWGNFCLGLTAPSASDQQERTAALCKAVVEARAHGWEQPEQLTLFEPPQPTNRNSTAPVPVARGRPQGAGNRRAKEAALVDDYGLFSR